MPDALFHVQRRGFDPATVIGIFLAVDRRHMRGVSIEIRPSDSKLLPVRIDPLPEGFGGGETLRPRRTVDAHNIRRKPVAVAAAEAASASTNDAATENAPVSASEHVAEHEPNIDAATLETDSGDQLVPIDSTASEGDNAEPVGDDGGDQAPRNSRSRNPAIAVMCAGRCFR